MGGSERSCAFESHMSAQSFDPPPPCRTLRTATSAKSGSSENKLLAPKLRSSPPPALKCKRWSFEIAEHMSKIDVICDLQASYAGACLHVGKVVFDIKRIYDIIIYTAIKPYSMIFVKWKAKGISNRIYFVDRGEI